MAEPQPPNVTEGADLCDALSANAEDRKAAAAMNSLDAKSDETAPKKEMDMKALQDAMKSLGGGTEGSKKATAGGVKKEAEVKKPVVKVDAGDVGLVAEQLDMSKAKATDLLRAHNADAVRAMTTFVTAAV